MEFETKRDLENQDAEDRRDYLAKQAREANERASRGILRDSAIEEMRHMVSNFDCCNETFNQRFSIAELVTLHRCWMLSGWDFNADQWEARQVQEALRGIVPMWDNDENPVYPGSTPVPDHSKRAPYPMVTRETRARILPVKGVGK